MGGRTRRAVTGRRIKVFGRGHAGRLALGCIVVLCLLVCLTLRMCPGPRSIAIMALPFTPLLTDMVLLVPLKHLRITGNFVLALWTQCPTPSPVSAMLKLKVCLPLLTLGFRLVKWTALLLLRTETTGLVKRVRTKPLITLWTITSETRLFRLPTYRQMAPAALLKHAWILRGLTMTICGADSTLLQMVTCVVHTVPGVRAAARLFLVCLLCMLATRLPLGVGLLELITAQKLLDTLSVTP